jgi:hypothetical protein
VGLGLLGLAIALYLGLYQLDLLLGVWEPFFGDGSRVILKESAIVRWLHPVPDALLGAFAYFLDVVFNCVGGRGRWRTQPWAVLASGLVACGLGVAAVVLVLCQPFWFHHFCTLCLGSAGCSVLIFGLVVGEVWATVQHLKRAHDRGQSLWRSLWGTKEQTRPAPPVMAGGRRTAACSCGRTSTAAC